MKRMIRCINPSLRKSTHSDEMEKLLTTRREVLTIHGGKPNPITPAGAKSQTAVV
jgi:hypothetical protein